MLYTESCSLTGNAQDRTVHRLTLACCSPSRHGSLRFPAPRRWRVISHSSALNISLAAFRCLRGSASLLSWLCGGLAGRLGCSTAAPLARVRRVLVCAAPGTPSHFTWRIYSTRSHMPCTRNASSCRLHDFRSKKKKSLKIYYSDLYILCRLKWKRPRAHRQCMRSVART